MCLWAGTHSLLIPQPQEFGHSVGEANCIGFAPLVFPLRKALAPEEPFPATKHFPWGLLARVCGILMVLGQEFLLLFHVRPRGYWWFSSLGQQVLGYRMEMLLSGGSRSPSLLRVQDLGSSAVPSRSWDSKIQHRRNVMVSLGLKRKRRRPFATRLNSGSWLLCR